MVRPNVDFRDQVLASVMRHGDRGITLKGIAGELQVSWQKLPHIVRHLVDSRSITKTGNLYSPIPAAPPQRLAPERASLKVPPKREKSGASSQLTMPYADTTKVRFLSSWGPTLSAVPTLMLIFAVLWGNFDYSDQVRIPTETQMGSQTLNPGLSGPNVALALGIPDSSPRGAAMADKASKVAPTTREAAVERSSALEAASPREPSERPEIAEFLEWKRSGTSIHWQLIDGSAIIGTLNWFDNYNVQVHVDGMGNLTIPTHSILWYREAVEP